MKATRFVSLFVVIECMPKENKGFMLLSRIGPLYVIKFRVFHPVLLHLPLLRQSCEQLDLARITRDTIVQHLQLGANEMGAHVLRKNDTRKFYTGSRVYHLPSWIFRSGITPSSDVLLSKNPL
jgi:hypothetical protein